MARIANLLFIGPAPESHVPDLRELEAQGFGVTVETVPDKASSRVLAEEPDVVLITPEAAEDPLALASRLKAEGATVPVALLTSPASMPSAEAILAHPVAAVFSLPLPAEALAWRLRPLGRLSTMMRERERRARTAETLGVAMSEAPVTRSGDESPWQVLAVGCAGETRLEALKRAGTAVEPLESLYDVEPALSARPFHHDALLIGQEAAPETALELCAELRHNPRLFNLPVVLLADEETAVSLLPYRRGASWVVGPEVSGDVLALGLTLAMGRQRHRLRLRQALSHTLTGATLDAATGCYTPAFQAPYLERAVADARRSGRSLAVTAFCVPSLTGLEDRFGAEAAANMRGQVGHWITGLVRAEDVVVHEDGNDFLVVLPDTPVAEAEMVMQRIAGVLSYTDFAVPDVYQPVSIWVLVGSAGLEKDDDPATLVARARGSLA